MLEATLSQWWHYLKKLSCRIHSLQCKWKWINKSAFSSRSVFPVAHQKKQLPLLFIVNLTSVQSLCRKTSFLLQMLRETNNSNQWNLNNPKVEHEHWKWLIKAKQIDKNPHILCWLLCNLIKRNSSTFLEIHFLI